VLLLLLLHRDKHAPLLMHACNVISFAETLQPTLQHSRVASKARVHFKRTFGSRQEQHLHNWGMTPA
jgi:hypothetical protein